MLKQKWRIGTVYEQKSFKQKVALDIIDDALYGNAIIN